MEGYILCLINWYFDHRKYEMKYLNMTDAEAILKSYFVAIPLLQAIPKFEREYFRFYGSPT